MEQATQDFFKRSLVPLETLKMNNKIQKWYLKAYPTDDMGPEINKDLTFGQLYKAMQEHKGFYGVIKACDSVIRERIFEALSVIKKCNYNEIYDLWLTSRKR